jgi:hypothetical protein
MHLYSSDKLVILSWLLGLQCRKILMYVLHLPYSQMDKWIVFHDKISYMHATVFV